MVLVALSAATFIPVLPRCCGAFSLLFLRLESERILFSTFSTSSAMAYLSLKTLRVVTVSVMTSVLAIIRFISAISLGRAATIMEFDVLSAMKTGLTRR
ncbi:hypothetical protein BMS3Bbin07_00564 [bacterium BMS3Bbin07]|nr:hypothetical protein BMS3Bbin07_00564 [bacterium BMS3Bbin07]